jgi:hypothetical protein
MSQIGTAPRITLRIPGDWSHPKVIRNRLPNQFQLTPSSLVMPDGSAIEFTPMPADRQFAGVFQSACGRPPTDDELALVARYTVNVVLSGPGGSLDSALTMMRAGAAIVRAGAAGVFIDNSARAHGGGDWLAMSDDGGTDAISFAFTSIIRRPHELYTMGMQTMGFPELVMRSSNLTNPADAIVEIIRYVAREQQVIDVGHLLADEHGPLFRVVAREQDAFDAESVMHNPYGRLKILSMREIAESN